MKYRTTWLTRSNAVCGGTVLVLLVVLLGWASTFAQETDETTSRRSSARLGKDYTPFPNPDAGYVTDLAGLLSPDEEERIEQWLWQTESKTRVEIIVVTLNSMKDYPGAPSRNVETFARGLFDAWGIGNMPENNGVLFLVARKDLRTRIELGAGHGRRNDRAAGRILKDDILPSFRKTEYAQGITAGVQSIILEYAKARVGIHWTLVIVLIAIPVVGLIAYSLFKSGKRGWGWVCVGVVIVLVLAAIRLVLGAAKHMGKGSSSSWSSGGLGGFGGGFSGGGGATGSW